MALRPDEPARFRTKPKMLDAAEVEADTGHPVGGVSPLGRADDVA